MAIDTEAEERHKAELFEWYQKELSWRLRKFIAKPSDATRTTLSALLNQYRQAVEGGRVKVPHLAGYN